jgi:glucan biosynthesis protein C
MDATSGFIHTFRMPLFFVISGFFTAMLFFEKGPENMLRNRIKRIFYPFLIGLIILIPLYLLGVNYFNASVGLETVSVFESLKAKITLGWENMETVHLWFLYYLLMYCLIAWGIARLAAKLPQLNNRVRIWYVVIFKSKLAPLAFATITFLCLATGNSIFIDGAFDLSLNLNCLISHGYFFLFGWFLYQSREELYRFLKYDKLYVCIAVFLFFVELFLIVSFPEIEKSSGIYLYYSFNAIISWLLIFGFTGLSLRYLNHYSSIGRYISDASYWVYLVHLPILVFLQGMLVGLHWHGIIKFTIVSAVTLLIAFISYNYLVRGSFIGQFLGGKKFKPGLVPKEILG